MFARTIRAMAVVLSLSAPAWTRQAPPVPQDTGAAPAPDELQGFALTVGDPAPPLRAARWLRGEGPTAFEPGTVYVVEFWATWCAPCLQVIPHMKGLQARYSDPSRKGPGVRFVAMSIWEDEPDAVEPFVERTGDRMVGTVGSDLLTEAQPEGASAVAWMDAAGQAQIPAAFIVDGRGRIAWIGHPLEVDRPLARIVAGDWDLARAALEHRRRMALVLARRRLGLQLAQLSRAGKWDEAVQVVETSLVDHPNLELELGLHKYELLARGGKRAECEAYGARLVEVVFKNEPGQLGALAWSIADPNNETPDRDLALARRAAERANELTGWSEASLVDILAVTVFEQGDTTTAVQLQQKAVRLAKGTALEEEFTRRLERFRTPADGVE